MPLRLNNQLPTLGWLVLLWLATTQCKETVTMSPAYEAFRNGSDYSLSLSFHGEVDSIGFDLQPGDTIRFLGTCESGFSNYCSFDWISGPEQREFEQATLVFEDGKRLTIPHENCKWDRQLFGSWQESPYECGYGAAMVADTLYYIFEINNSDYAAATMSGE